MESLYVQAVLNNCPDEAAQLYDFPEEEQALQFAMRCNGFFGDTSNHWESVSATQWPIIDHFSAQRISFFGPIAAKESDNFFLCDRLPSGKYLAALSQPSVKRLIGKHMEQDLDQAVRLSFLLGGLVRHFKDRPASQMEKIVDSAAHIALLGQSTSADAIMSSMAIYFMSGGEPKFDNAFKRNVFFMAQAVEEDPITPNSTYDLGLSQVARNRIYSNLLEDLPQTELPDLARYGTALNCFPTVGAEFHLPPESLLKDPKLLQKLVILNMSQYQPGSHIQMSRKDKNIIEVRMNPSVYPVTMANWEYLKNRLPLLGNAFFWTTLNRVEDNDFSYSKNGELNLINQLRELALLSYAAVYEEVVANDRPSEINFGEIYLGQTVRLIDGKYKFSGLWSGGGTGYGQISFYTGFGDNFPHLAYYLSMALVKPSILSPIRKHLPSINTLGQAIELGDVNRRFAFNSIDNLIQGDSYLSQAAADGRAITEQLMPD